MTLSRGGGADDTKWQVIFAVLLQHTLLEANVLGGEMGAIVGGRGAKGVGNGRVTGNI